MTTCNSTYKDGVAYNYPSMWIEDGDCNSSLTQIYFPGFEGYDVFSVSGGKTMSVCLVKGER